MRKHWVVICCVVLSCAFIVVACSDDTPDPKAPTPDASAADLRADVLKDHDTLVVPRDGETQYDLKPFFATLHGVAKSQIRTSNTKSQVEFDTDDCSEDDELFELSYQVSGKDKEINIECADSSTGLPDSVDEGFLFLAGNKIYMYTLDDNDGKKDKVPISAGELLFFSAASKNLNASKKLRRQEITFKGDDDETEASEVGAVLAFGAAGDVKVEDTTLGTAGAAKGDGFLFIAVHWGTDDGADDFFGLGQDEEDNVQKAQPSSGSNNDDNDDSGGGDSGGNSGDDDDNDGDSGDSSGDGDGAGGSNDDDSGNNNGDSDSDDDDDVAGAANLVAPFADAKVQAGTSAGSLNFSWACNTAAADSMYHLASAEGDLDSCAEVSVESTPLADRTLAGVHILKKTASSNWSKAGYIAARAVTKTGSRFKVVLTDVDTGIYQYAVAPAKGESDLAWGRAPYLTQAQLLETGATGTTKVSSCTHNNMPGAKEFAVLGVPATSIQLCVPRNKRCGFKPVPGKAAGADCECQAYGGRASSVSGFVWDGKCAMNPIFKMLRYTQHNTKGLTLEEQTRLANPIGHVKFTPMFGFPPYASWVAVDRRWLRAFRQEIEICEKTNNVGVWPSGNVQGGSWCKGQGELRSPWVFPAERLAVAANVRHYFRMRALHLTLNLGDANYWRSPWVLMQADSHTRFWGFSDSTDATKRDVLEAPSGAKVLYGGKGNDWLSDTTQTATNMTFLVDSFSWDLITNLEQRFALGGTSHTTHIKCYNASHTLKMVILERPDNFSTSNWQTHFQEATHASDALPPSACALADAGLRHANCKGVRIVINSQGHFHLSGTFGGSLGGTADAPKRLLYFKCN